MSILSDEPESRLEPEFEAPFQAWKRRPNPHTASTLLKSVQPVIDKAIAAHVGQSSPLLRSRGRQIALKALGTYDPYQSKLQTHLISQLQGLKRVNRQQTQVIHVPERVALEQGHMAEMENELRDELGRDPTTAELSDRSGMSLKRIAKLRQFQQPMAEGFFSQHAHGDDEPNLPAVQGEANPNLWAEMVYDDLDPTNQSILEHSLGLHGRPVLSNMDIAKKLQLTPGAISQRRAVIQRRLDQGSLLSPFGY
jgi:DNA-directed RNA polymerase specialized sigma subunit